MRAAKMTTKMAAETKLRKNTEYHSEMDFNQIKMILIIREKISHFHSIYTKFVIDLLLGNRTL